MEWVSGAWGVTRRKRATEAQRVHQKSKDAAIDMAHSGGLIAGNLSVGDNLRFATQVFNELWTSSAG
jgi:hypothetical protein